MKKQEKNKQKNFYIMIIIIIFLIIFIDQLSKFLIIENEETSILSGNIILKQVEASDSGEDETAKGVTIITNILILGIVLKIIGSNNQFVNNKIKILLSFLFAGGASNLIDRLFRGNIINFINIGNFPSFNIAYIFILIGWISFVAIFASFSSKELTNKSKMKKEIDSDKQSDE